MTSPGARPIRALFVTGAYYPEISAGGVQCRAIARCLVGEVDVRVLTTTTDPRLPRREVVDGVPVRRVAVDVSRRRSRLAASPRMLADLLALVPWSDLVHVQGTSGKNLLVTVMAKVFGRRVIISLQTAVQDEPPAIRRQGRLAWWAFRSAYRYLSVSPALIDAYLAAGLPRDRIAHVPNGVDTERFAPATPEVRGVLRAELGVPDGRPVIAFVGFFSHDKQPEVLFDAWCRLQERGVDTTLLFVGATRSAYFEVDDGIAERIRASAARRGVVDRIVFTGPTHRVHDYLRAADVFALPSRREGTPLALLEAMACGLPCVASRLPGATDVIIDDGRTGLLVPPGDAAALAEALHTLITDPARAAAMATAARGSVEQRYATATIARRWLAAYRQTEDAA